MWLKKKFQEKFNLDSNQVGLRILDIYLMEKKLIVTNECSNRTKMP